MRKASNRYGVSHYPTFIAIEPNSDGNNFSTFTKQRSYANLKFWITGLMKTAGIKSYSENHQNSFSS